MEDEIATVNEPMPGSQLAESITNRFGSVVRETKWLGAGSLSKLVKSGERDGLAAVRNLVFDPRRHGPVAETEHASSDNMAGLSRDLADFIEKLVAVGWPKSLGPTQIDVIIRETSRQIADGVTERKPLSTAVRDAIRGHAANGRLPPQLVIGHANINFMLHNMTKNGTVFGESCSTEDELRLQLYKTLLHMIVNRIGPLTPKSKALISELLSIAPAPASEVRSRLELSP
ncbi:MAG: hypothetical protein M2R45_02460 [Verrucomicrobia subdivision 3 bacterium]|nr:hypothetical protein [Limisphaerales bacterium]